MLATMVREARLEDAAGIARVQVASWHAAYSGLMAERRLAAFTVPVRTEAWKRSLSGAGRRSPVINTVFEDGEGIAGFASYGESRDLVGWGEIWALYVHPDKWGRGIGSALFAEAMAQLTLGARRRVMLWMLEGNQRALQFYQGNGFLLDGARKVEDGMPQLRLRWER
jgi:GNAT superfamily N-acetyltransferase